MAKEQELFGYEMPKGKALEEVTKRLLEGRPRILRRRFNLDKVYGPNTYINVGEQIEKDGLRKPIMAEVASLVYNAFNSKNKSSNEIKKIMKNEWLWAFTGILYVPNKGAYIQDNPEISSGKVYMKESDLEKKLSRNNPSVKFVPFGYKIGEMTPKELGKNQYVIALAGKAGAQKLAKVADKHKHKPYLWCLESVNKPLTRVSAVGSRWKDDRLDVRDGYRGDDSDGCVFGVQKNTREVK